MQVQMRKLTLVMAVSLLPAGLALGQMKLPPAKSPQMTATGSGSSPVIITPVAQPKATLESARRISRDEAIKLVRQDKAVYVDVRSKASYDSGHIKGALSIPRSELLNRLKEIPPGHMIITYCACKEQEHTSALAVLELNAHGVKNAAALKGGWLEWTAAHLPVENSLVARKN